MLLFYTIRIIVHVRIICPLQFIVFLSWIDIPTTDEFETNTQFGLDRAYMYYQFKISVHVTHNQTNVTDF